MTKKEIAKAAKAYGSLTVEERAQKMQELGMNEKDIADVENFIALQAEIDGDQGNTDGNEGEEGQVGEEPKDKNALKTKNVKQKGPQTLNKVYNVIRLVQEGNKLLEGPILRTGVKLTDDRAERLNEKSASTKIRYKLA